LCTSIFVLSQVVDYFASHGNSVYLPSLDAFKAFDRVNHVKLFDKLIDRRLPGNIIEILIDWYGKVSVSVKWNNCFSKCACKSDIRQGGILSPVLFNIYMDSLILGLKSSGLGCQFQSFYVGCVAYADDILLLSGSVCLLQKVLSLCSDNADQLRVCFNDNKSCLLKIGNSFYKKLENLQLNGQYICWFNKINYFGTHVVSGKSFKIDVSTAFASFVPVLMQYSATRSMLVRCHVFVCVSRLFYRS